MTSDDLEKYASSEYNIKPTFGTKLEENPQSIVNQALGERKSIVISNDDKELVDQAIALLIQVANKYVKDGSTRQYINMALLFIRTLLK